VTNSIAELVAEVLDSVGVRRVYTVPGESFIGLLDVVERHCRMRLISTRHESGAAFMADADAKMTGIPAVALAGRGPGASNLAIGVHTARHDSTPMIVLLGQVSSDLLGREAFQEVDLAAFYAPITKWAINASTGTAVPGLVARAAQISMVGRPGPAAVSVPADFFEARVDEIPRFMPRVTELGRPALSSEDALRVARLLNAATRPVIIAGGGAARARESLITAAEHFSAGVYAAFRRQDVFPNNHPLYLGHLGNGAPSETLIALEQADLVLVIGCRLSELTTQGYRFPGPGITVLQIDVDERSIGAGSPVDIGMVAEAGTALRSLQNAMPKKAPGRDWNALHEAWERSATPPRTESSGTVHPADVYASMLDVLPADSVIANDAGNFSFFLHRYWRYLYRQTQLAPTSGAMGYAVPAAVAGKLVRPHRTVVAVVGDGGMLMTGHELETAVRYDAPILVVVFQNLMYGTIAMHQAQKFGRMAGVHIDGPVDFAGYARALGGEGITVDDSGSLRDAFAEAVKQQVPTVVDIRTDPDVISPAARLSELMSGDAQRQSES
jgi:acetolactate synthase-1/2/3 large subunit